MACLEIAQLTMRGADPPDHAARWRKQGVVAICIHPGRRGSTWSWTEANPLVDEALGSPRQRAMPAATKAGGSSHARAAEGSRSCSGRIAAIRAEAKAEARDQKR
jgi:hypothetical protein